MIRLDSGRHTYSYYSRGDLVQIPKTVYFLSTTSPIPSSVVVLAAHQPDGGGVWNSEPYQLLMLGYTRRLTTFRVLEVCDVAGQSFRPSERPHPTGWCAENANPDCYGGGSPCARSGGIHARPTHSRASSHPGWRGRSRMSSP